MDFIMYSYAELFSTIEINCLRQQQFKTSETTSNLVPRVSLLQTLGTRLDYEKPLLVRRAWRKKMAERTPPGFHAAMFYSRFI